MTADSGLAYRERLSLASLATFFFLSGAAGLAAQVVFGRLLSYVFGATHLAGATVLAAYMAGLSLGALLLGRRTKGVRRPVRLYGFLELGVALFLTATPHLFGAFQEMATGLGRSLVDQPGSFLVVRFVLAFAFVLAPTILMGGTLPALVTAFRGREAISRALPVLYGINTLGAAFGSLYSAYALIPSVGLYGTLYVAAIVNAGVGVLAIGLSERAREGSSAEPPPEARPETARPESATPEPPPSLEQVPVAGGILCLAAFLQGALAFVLEVVWAHLIGTVIGVTVFALSLMLAGILLGIGLGSALLPRLRRFRSTPLVVFAWAQLALGLSLVSSLYLWDRFPDVITATLWLTPDWSFGAREAVRFAFVLVLLGPASTALGVALPALAAAHASGVPGPEEKSAGAWVGLVFAANTVGAIAGALLGGWVLLGRFSSESILVGGAIMAAALGVSLFLLAASRTRPSDSRPGLRPALAFAALVLVAAIAHPGWDAARLTSGAHYYWQGWPAPPPHPPTFLREDAQSGFISVDRLPNGVKVLKTNGKYEGNDAPGEFQDHFALIGALYLRGFDRAALVGLGPGRTLALLHAMPFRNIDALEFSPAIVEAAEREFPGFVAAPLADRARVRLVRDDGRNFLQVSRHTYDFVVVGITGAAFAGTGNIYTTGFFETVRARLSPRGVFLLWIQVHHVLAREVRSVVYTLRRVFPHVHFYSIQNGSQGYLVASPAPLEIGGETVDRLSKAPAIRRTLDLGRLRSLADLAILNVFTSDAEIGAYLADGALAGEAAVLLTDENPAFEYATPRGLAERIAGFDFQQFSAKRLPRFDPPLPPGDEAGLQGLRYLVARDWARALRALERSQEFLGTDAWRPQIEALRSLRGPGEGAGPATGRPSS